MNITFSAGKNTVEVLCMTEKIGLEKTVVFNLKSENESDVNNIVNEKGRESRSFYYKLGLLYFLNIVDWICTEALIGSGHFVEANPVMQPVLENFWLTLLIKGILPLVLVLGCALIYKLAEIGRSKTAEMLLTVGIVSYALVNLWHIFNFVLLFCQSDVQVRKFRFSYPKDGRTRKAARDTHLPSDCCRHAVPYIPDGHFLKGNSSRNRADFAVEYLKESCYTDSVSSDKAHLISFFNIKRNIGKKVSFDKSHCKISY